MPYHEDIPNFIKPSSTVKPTPQTSEEPDRESVFELDDTLPLESFDISLQLLGGGLDAIETVLQRSQIQHLTSLNIQTSRDWQRQPDVDLRLVFVDGADTEALRHLKHEPALEEGPLTILVLINADRAELSQLPVSRQSVVDTQIQFSGAEDIIHQQVDQFYRFLLSTVYAQQRLVCVDWADIRCVLLLSRRLEFRGGCPSEVDSLAQAADCLIRQFSQQQLQQTKSLLLYEHSSAALSGGQGRAIEGFSDACDLVIGAVADDCYTVVSIGFQVPEDGPGITGLLIGLPSYSAEGV